VISVIFGYHAKSDLFASETALSGRSLEEQSSLRTTPFPFFFPFAKSFSSFAADGHQKGRNRVKVAFLRITGGVQRKYARITIIGDMKDRWMLDRREGAARQGA
jgi:hypothetical protein